MPAAGIIASARRLSGDVERAEKFWQTALADGALPSPADDYFLPEHNPLWQSLDPTQIRAVQRNREQARQRLQSMR